MINNSMYLSSSIIININRKAPSFTLYATQYIKNAHSRLGEFNYDRATKQFGGSGK